MNVARSRGYTARLRWVLMVVACLPKGFSTACSGIRGFYPHSRGLNEGGGILRASRCDAEALMFAKEFVKEDAGMVAVLEPSIPNFVCA